MVATFGPASPGNLIHITPEKPAVIPANTLEEGQAIRVTIGSGNVFADLGCPDPESLLAESDAEADRLHRHRVEESARRMSEIHRDALERLAGDD